MNKAAERDYVSVNEYLDTLNEGMASFGGRIVGEVSGLQLYETRSYLFFSIKDKDTDSVLKCFMWKTAYKLSGVELEDGLEIVVAGFPKVYKSNGGLNFQVQTIELVGEGALKKAYDKLKTQLEKEGLFSISKKKTLPLFPQKIGLITSRNGAAIGDFLANLGKFGFKVSLIDSRVEGQLATQELFDSVRSFKNKDIDVLVIIRGGGSLESFLPFNNEMMVREIADFPIPVLVGVGHERDVPLLGLAADKMVSTPTAAAQILNYPWQQATARVELSQEKLFSTFRTILTENGNGIEYSFQAIRTSFQSILEKFDRAEESLKRAYVAVQSRIGEIGRNLSEYPRILSHRMNALITTTERHLSTVMNPLMTNISYTIRSDTEKIESAEKLLSTHDPGRQLRLGYSIVHLGKSVIRKLNQIEKGEVVGVRVTDGSFEAEIKKINK